MSDDRSRFVHAQGEEAVTDDDERNRDPDYGPYTQFMLRPARSEET